MAPSENDPDMVDVLKRRYEIWQTRSMQGAGKWFGIVLAVILLGVFVIGIVFGETYSTDPTPEPSTPDPSSILLPVRDAELHPSADSILGPDGVLVVEIRYPTPTVAPTPTETPLPVATQSPFDVFPICDNVATPGPGTPGVECLPFIQGTVIVPTPNVCDPEDYTTNEYTIKPCVKEGT